MVLAQMPNKADIDKAVVKRIHTGLVKLFKPTKGTFKGITQVQAVAALQKDFKFDITSIVQEWYIAQNKKGTIKNIFDGYVATDLLV